MTTRRQRYWKRNRGRPIWTTREERETIDRAVAALRLAEDDRAIREGRALELICADFLAQVDTGEQG